MFQKISENVFAFISSSEGSNCFLLKGSRQTALIDSSSATNSQQLFDALEGLSLKPEQVNLILHTHGHADHFGNDFLFKKAKIAMHQADALAVNKKDPVATCSSFYPDSKYPKVTESLNNRQLIDLGNLQLEVFTTPGHTAGSVCFFLLGQTLLFSGDTLFNSGIGRTDLPTGNRKELIGSLEKLSGLSFSTLLPGHGGILEGAKENKQNLESILHSVKTNAFI